MTTFKIISVKYHYYFFFFCDWLLTMQHCSCICDLRRGTRPRILPLKWTGRMKKPQSSLSTPSGLLQHHGLPAVPRNSTDSPSSTFSFCPHPFGLAVRLWIVVVAGCIQCPVSKYPSFPQLNRSLNGHWPQKILRIPEMNVRNFALGKQNRQKTAENQLHFRVPSAGKFMATFGWKVSGGKW